MGELQKQLINWYQKHQRTLPWRTNPSLYKTVVSEFMLQQTRVDTALPYFHAWQEKFPDFLALANASEEDVVKAWEGLGYYSRARNLRKLAIALCELEAIPEEPKDWQTLPGVGPYTSAAICSISYGFPIAVVDGNVIRVLSRIFDVDQEFKDNSAAVKFFTPIANDFLLSERAGDFNQAMMELGATVCHRQKPLCLLCPVNSGCQAFKSKTMENRPRFKATNTILKEVNRAVVIKDKQVLLFRHPQNSKRLANVYEFPEIQEMPKKNDGKSLFKKKRSISNERITETFYSVEESQFKNRENLEWHDIEFVKELSLSGPHKKWFPSIIAEVFK